MKRSIITLALLVLTSFAFAQESTYFFPKSNKINRAGMMVLGGWAIANMATGTYGTLKFSGEEKYFHQMNLMWNVVNAGIASYAIYQFYNTDYTSFTSAQQLAKHIDTERLYLINAGLDVLYMAGGAIMINASKKNEKRRDLLSGYGKSVVLQGGFLFVFDLAMYFIQYNHRINFGPHVQSLSITPMGLSASFTF
jgi:hypothetical protein